MPERTNEAHSPREVAVLVPAAGRGTRLGGVRKQLRQLGGAPVVVQTLRALQRCAAVGHLVVAGPSGDEGTQLRGRVEEAGLEKLHAVVEGGASRQASVQRALRAAPGDVRVVLVHDAVRPFVRAERVRAVVRAVRAHGAAALAVPVSDTLRRGREGRFGETVDRAGCFQMQTPQGFRRAWLARALTQAAEAASPDGSPHATDDVALVQRAGHTVQIVAGDRRNFKITTPADWKLAEMLWPMWTKGRGVDSGEKGEPG